MREGSGKRLGAQDRGWGLRIEAGGLRTETGGLRTEAGGSQERDPVEGGHGPWDREPPG
jgi:hypothetical protein